MYLHLFIYLFSEYKKIGWQHAHYVFMLIRYSTCTKHNVSYCYDSQYILLRIGHRDGVLERPNRGIF